MESHGKIFEFWKNKCITEQGTVEIEGNYDFSKSIAVIEDWGEPQCWLCGKQINVPSADCSKDYKKWDNAKVRSELNRCHIVPKAFGGADTADNLFLLCENCHEKTPDTENPKYFLQYIYEQRKNNIYFNGLNFSEILIEFINLCIKNKKDFRTFKGYNNNFKVNSHGGKTAITSMIYKALDNTEDFNSNDLNEYINYLDEAKEFVNKIRVTL